jgi:hypothetical protein
MIRPLDLFKVLEQYRKQGMSVPSDFHVHPDDWEELCKQLVRFPTDTPKTSFLGVKIVLDENAERLPRKKQEVTK